jgi:predicted TIM-barrel fold metal-dependent hydrolase
VPLLGQLADVYKKVPNLFPGDPVEEIRTRIHISPFWEDNLAELAGIVGVERVLFGSDYPHPEGLAEPVRYIDVLNERTKLTEEEKAKVMGGNLARLMAA